MSIIFIDCHFFIYAYFNTKEETPLSEKLKWCKHLIATKLDNNDNVYNSFCLSLISPSDIADFLRREFARNNFVRFLFDLVSNNSIEIIELPNSADFITIESF
ncbi:MAG: hypothetical protein BAJALOKI1v1_70016 [Promethearchaeota archaeon]|nr:MAG: hypothetical protein BAJALOKI1v1_70016 [Candidatus Lokiarchaeota archaeon]